MKRLSRTEAKKLVQQCVREGRVSFTNHAQEELEADGMSTADALNILRLGHILTEGEEVRGTWRYRVSTLRFVVVVAFRDTTPVITVVVTAWRK